MAGLLDGINKAVSKLQDIGTKAAEGAKELLDKTDIDEKIMDAANQAKDKAEDVVSDLKDKVSK